MQGPKPGLASASLLWPFYTMRMSELGAPRALSYFYTSYDSFLKAIQNKASPSRKYLQLSGTIVPIWNTLGSQEKG